MGAGDGPSLEDGVPGLLRVGDLQCRERQADVTLVEAVAPVGSLRAFGDAPLDYGASETVDRGASQGQVLQDDGRSHGRAGCWWRAWLRTQPAAVADNRVRPLRQGSGPAVLPHTPCSTATRFAVTEVDTTEAALRQVHDALEHECRPIIARPHGGCEQQGAATPCCPTSGQRTWRELCESQSAPQHG